MQNISGVWKVDVVESLDYDKGQRLFHLEILAEDEGPPSLNRYVDLSKFYSWEYIIFEFVKKIFLLYSII
jgi:hypothetical protein